MTTVRQTLDAMRDHDASASADLLEREVQDLDAASNCGKAICTIFEALHQFLKSLEAVQGHSWRTEEERWALWSDAVEAAHVLYFG